MNTYFSVLATLPIDLSLFDGAAGAPAGEGEGGEAAQAGTTATPDRSRRANSGDLSNVIYGVTDAAAADNGDGADDGKTGSDAASEEPQKMTRDQTRAKFRELINGDYKDAFSAEVQRIIDRRFRDSKDVQERLNAQQPVLDKLFAKYGIKDGDVAALDKALDSDNDMWESAAVANGMSREQYQSEIARAIEIQRLTRENESYRQAQRQYEQQQMAQRQYAEWEQQAESVKAQYPEFDFRAAISDPRFTAMLRAGVSVADAYSVVNMQQRLTDTAANAAAAAERSVVAGIRARGQRPAENGTGTSGTGAVHKTDVSKLTPRDRAEIARRVLRGDTVSFDK